MGTNYYAHSDVCDHCGRSDDPLHICKSYISFQGHKQWSTTLDDWEPWIDSWAKWKEHLSKPGMRVFDEYGREHTVAAFIAKVEEVEPQYRSIPHQRQVEYDGGNTMESFVDDEGYSFAWREFS